MAKIVPYQFDDGEGNQDRGWRFWCPGCATEHVLLTEPAAGRQVPTWVLYGTPEHPTFRPALLHQHFKGNWADSQREGDPMWIAEGDPIVDCHLLITAGRIAYYADSGHELAGSTCGMVEFPEDDDTRVLLAHMDKQRFLC